MLGAMLRRELGASDLSVSALGLGCGPLGAPIFEEREAERLLHRAIERGITLFDTARSYGVSEERIGRALASHRDSIVLSTKVGYGVEGHEDWTGPCIAAGIERALRMLAVERIDIVHLHSCPRSILAREDVLRALEHAVRAGKVRIAAYSGEEEDLEAALATGCFGAVQISVSPWDQRSLRTRVPAMIERGIGVLAKRPLANAAWRHAERPAAHDVALYWDRVRALAIDPGPLSFSELALRFVAYARGVTSALCGTTSIAHLDAAVDAIERGPLAPELVGYLEQRFQEVGADLPGIV
jgi:aryl-alcohol dehydrogenase-like predicted oxidoreductase